MITKPSSNVRKFVFDSRNATRKFAKAGMSQAINNGGWINS